MTEILTVAAIATPAAPGGIGIIRISGSDALNVAGKIFRPAAGGSIESSRGYRAHFGHIYDNNERIDEAVCLVFRAPHSYTGENVAEISCHGGLYVTQRVLRAALNAGAQAAGPGEFTKRAFLNGKIDLAGSEAVMALISASGKRAADAALNTLEGKLSDEIRRCADSIIGVCAALSAWVDYPDDETPETGADEMRAVFTAALDTLKGLVRRFDCGRVLTEGVDAVIVGRPNVGKSTLMNMLTGFDRSIVTPLAGTTRDVVEEKVRVGEIILRIADTAGIRETDNPIENIGVSLAKKRLERAEIVLAVFDGAAPLSEDDIEILKACQSKLTVAIINKTDLPREADIDIIRQSAGETVELCAADGQGAEELERAITRLLSASEFDPDAACLTGERQRACCCEAIGHLEQALSALNEGVTVDAVNVCADCAVEALLELTGEKASSAVVNEIFSRFCVGK